VVVVLHEGVVVVTSLFEVNFRTVAWAFIINAGLNVLDMVVVDIVKTLINTDLIAAKDWVSVLSNKVGEIAS
jgi:hypothetical protein